MVAKAKVSSKNQIVVPAEVRRELDIKPGDYLYFVTINGRTHILHEPDDWLDYMHGLGRDVWKDIDVDEYINQERDAWEG